MSEVATPESTGNAGATVKIAIVVALLLAVGAVVYARQQRKATTAAATPVSKAGEQPDAALPRLVDLGRGT